MSDLKLVAPDQPTPLERLLLDAATNESPSAEQRMRVRAALGLAVMTMPPPPVARVGRIASLGKVAIGGAIAASAIIALVLSGVLHKPASSPGTTLAMTRATPPTVAPPPRLPLPVETSAEPVASPLPPIEPPTDQVAGNPTTLNLSGRNSAKPIAKSISSVSKSPVPVDSASDLGEQLRLIDAARAAIAAGNSSAASQALSSYSTKFPRGSFGQEAAVLRIETMDLQGNHAQAASLAKTFLAQHPNSPHVSLVQRIADRGH